MSNQGTVQAALRERTGTAHDFNGDWHAVFDLDGIPPGPFNGRMLQWLNKQLGHEFASLPGAQAAFAQRLGYSRWTDIY